MPFLRRRVAALDWRSALYTIMQKMKTSRMRFHAMQKSEMWYGEPIGPQKPWLAQRRISIPTRKKTISSTWVEEDKGDGSLG